MRTLLHYTLNTVHTVASAQSGVGPEVIATLRPLVEHGGPIPGRAPFRVIVDHIPGSAIFTVWRAKEPIVTCVLAWTPEGALKAWPAIEKIYLDLSDKCPELVVPGRVVEEPGSLPWLAEVALPPVFLTTSCSDIGWIGNFERGMAWAILGNRASNASS